MNRVLSSDGEDCGAVLVDFDGTLYRQAPVRLLMGAEVVLFGAGSLRALRVFRQEHERLRGLCVDRAPEADDGCSPFQRQLENAAAAAGLPSQRMRVIVDEWMFRRPGKWLPRFVRWPLVRELQALSARGVKLAIVSDYPVARKLRALNIPVAFDAIVSSGEAGGPARLKPHPEGYLLAARRLGVPAQRCLVVGDRDDADGEAARRAGMSFLLVR
jgi:FMN phosphatase YigB (HAD superfamily)